MTLEKKKNLKGHFCQKCFHGNYAWPLRNLHKANLSSIFNFFLYSSASAGVYWVQAFIMLAAILGVALFLHRSKSMYNTHNYSIAKRWCQNEFIFSHNMENWVLYWSSPSDTGQSAIWEQHALVPHYWSKVNHLQ